VTFSIGSNTEVNVFLCLGSENKALIKDRARNESTLCVTQFLEIPATGQILNSLNISIGLHVHSINTTTVQDCQSKML
jgi:hypothetical protein